jgi:DnaK suppressor protein
MLPRDGSAAQLLRARGLTPSGARAGRAGLLLAKVVATVRATWRAVLGIHPALFEGMDHATLDQFRRALLGRRASLLQRWRQALADENELLAEREPDWEDDAAAETGTSMLDRIGERGRRALARIQSSLVRIERGSYDECAACHDAIDEERLLAVPDTDRCGHCATEN